MPFDFGNCEVVESTPRNKFECFPVKDGKVYVVFKDWDDSSKEHSFVLNSIRDLFIHDAFEMDGSRIHSLKGIGQETLVKSIFKKVFVLEMYEARFATCIFLKQIQEAYESNNHWVQTIFGFKYLDFRTRSKVSWNEFLV